MNLKKGVCLASIFALLALNYSYAIAATVVGQITVTDQTGYTLPAASADIQWDDTYGGTNNGSGSISKIKVRALVEPLINLRISKSMIDLGDITGNAASGSLFLEVGTNSTTGVVINATSEYGGLKNTITSDMINSDTGGTYQFLSNNGGDTKSGATFIGSTGVNVNSGALVHEIYSYDKPENMKDPDTTDVEFKVLALAQASATAGEYDDYITFTVISNF